MRLRRLRLAASLLSAIKPGSALEARPKRARRVRCRALRDDGSSSLQPPVQISGLLHGRRRSGPQTPTDSARRSQPPCRARLSHPTVGSACDDDRSWTRSRRLGRIGPDGLVLARLCARDDRREHRARALFEKLLSFAGPLHLYAEEIDAESGQHLGNYPQAFTHLALIDAALRLIDAERDMSDTDEDSGSLRRILLPLALAQFICSFAGSNMNVMLTDISDDLDTTVQGVQVAITVFLLVMAAFMIPGGKLTDRWGRKRCFTLGLLVYAVGALLSAAAPSLGVLILGNSILEGLGTCLLIPPVYILTTMFFHDMTSRARAFGIITGMGGVGAAAGPLIGGLITTAIDWRAAFVFQAIVIAMIIWLSRSITDPVPADPTRPFDVPGTILSAAGLVLVVTGVLAADNDLVLTAVLVVSGAAAARPVLVAHPQQGTSGWRGVALDRALPESCVEPRPRHPERAVAAPDGHRVRRVGVLAGRAGLQRDPDRSDLHRCHRRNPGVFARGRATRQEVPPAHASS